MNSLFFLDSNAFIYSMISYHCHLAVNVLIVNLLSKFYRLLMDNSFSRVKSIIDRLREVLKCQECSQMKEENSMFFYHVCDHFYCVDCMGDAENCPVCKNPLDKPTHVMQDKNILSLYNSLAKFELPSKDEIEKIYNTHKETKENKQNENTKLNEKKQEEVQETPKKQTKSRTNLRRKKINNTSLNESGTIIISSEGGESGNTPKAINIIEESPSISGKGKKNSTPAAQGRSFTALTSTPNVRGKSLKVASTSARKQRTSSVMNTSANSKGNASLNKSNINKRNPKGETRLHLACKKSNFAEMTELIAAGANPNAQDNAGWTPLHDSVFSGNVEVIKFLLDNGAKVNAPGLEKTTALHEGIAKGNIKIVKLLLEYGADVNAMNIFKETPMDLVNKYELEEMKEVLLEASKNTRKTSEEPEEEEIEQIIIYKYNLPIDDEKLVNKFAEKFEGEIIQFLTWKTSPTHIIVPNDRVQLTWALVSSVPNGCWVVTTDWVKESLSEVKPKPSKDYVPATPSFSGFAKARANNLNQLPGLFSGCHFFFGGNFEHYTVKNLTCGKEDLKDLVERNGGAIVKRCPDPESLALEKTIPFHAPATSSLRETSYFIIYQTEKWDPKPKYNMSHMKTLPVEWLLCCVLKFELIDPSEKETWSDFL